MRKGGLAVRIGLVLFGLAAFALSACSQTDEELVAAYDGISPDDAISLGGAEPFWAITINDNTLTYSAPDIPDGINTQVDRFAGNGGLSFSGRLDDQAITAMVTPADCSDGMSDRIYPFTATVQWGDSALEGCGHTEQHPFSGEEAP